MSKYADRTRKPRTKAANNLSYGTRYMARVATVVITAERNDYFLAGRKHLTRFGTNPLL